MQNQVTQLCRNFQEHRGNFGINILIFLFLILDMPLSKKATSGTNFTSNLPIIILYQKRDQNYFEIGKLWIKFNHSSKMSEKFRSYLKHILSSLSFKWLTKQDSLGTCQVVTIKKGNFRSNLSFEAKWGKWSLNYPLESLE